MRPHRALRAVPAREWPDVVAAAGVAAAVEIGLRTLTLPVLARLCGVPLLGDPGSARDGTDGAAGRCARSTGRATAPAAGWVRVPPRARRRLRATTRVMRHWPWGGTCLRHALVAGNRLRHLDPRLRVGVAKVDGRVQAHAWLEIDGVSLDPAATEFAVLEAVRPEEIR